VDDVAFVRAILDDVASFQPLAKQRVYATGMSNGGIFTHYLATKLGDRLAAIAPVAGGITDELALHFPPPQALPVLIVHGTEDRIVPYGGGAVLRTRGNVIPNERAVTLWREAASLPAKGEQDLLPDSDPADGCRVARSRWQRGASEVQWLRVEGGGHTWPGGLAYLGERIVGRTCRDIDASELIWSFFKAHTLQSRD
jgi:polyhydroxybutyrate depolymerase